MAKSSRRFLWTITEAALFLDKSPVTLRKWEEVGFFEFPRDQHGTRRLDADAMVSLAQAAFTARRINTRRFDLIRHAMAYMETIEKENKP